MYYISLNGDSRFSESVYLSMFDYDKNLFFYLTLTSAQRLYLYPWEYQELKSFFLIH